MKYYFQLQYKMLNRQIIEFGLPPLLGYILGVATFLAISFLLFFKIPAYGAYIYLGVGVGFLGILTDKSRNDFLKKLYSDNKYRQIRLIENLFLIFPFVCFLLYKNSGWIALIMLGIAAVSAFFNTKNEWNYALPTPFSRYPFEFVVGFRKTFYFFLGAYFLTYMAISVGNFNLGLFALGVVFFICISFYSEPEDAFFVWIFSATPKEFIFKKIRIAFISSTILSIPVILSLLIFFTAQWWIVLIVQLIGYLFLVMILLAKYAAYPRQISVPQAIIIGLGLWLPPLLLGIIPFFYQQSIKKLNQILA